MDEETSEHLICLIVIMVLICASFLWFKGGMNVFCFLFKVGHVLVKYTCCVLCCKEIVFL